MPQFLRLNRCIPPPILLGKRPVQLHHVPLNRRPIPIHLTVLQLDPISLLSRYHAAKLREVVSAAVLTARIYAVATSPTNTGERRQTTPQACAGPERP